VYLAYVDDSGNHDLQRVALYGAVIVKKPWDYHFIERHWGIAAEQLLPPDRIHEFKEFKAHDLFKGLNAFEGVSEDKRFLALEVLIKAVRDHGLLFVYSAVDRLILRDSPLASADPRQTAFQMCLLGIEDWAQSQSAEMPGGGVKVEPRNFVLVLVDENKDDAKLKDRLTNSFRTLRAKWLAPSQTFKKNRLWHLHDAMYFGDSRDSVGLQMADLFAYFVAAHLAGKLDENGERFYNQIKDRLICAKPAPEWDRMSYLLMDHKC
jgi:hypothetical protein